MISPLLPAFAAKPVRRPAGRPPSQRPSRPDDKKPERLRDDSVVQSENAEVIRHEACHALVALLLPGVSIKRMKIKLGTREAYSEAQVDVQYQDLLSNQEKMDSYYKGKVSNSEIIPIVEAKKILLLQIILFNSGGPCGDNLFQNNLKAERFNGGGQDILNINQVFKDLYRFNSILQIAKSSDITPASPHYYAQYKALFEASLKNEVVIRKIADKAKQIVSNAIKSFPNKSLLQICAEIHKIVEKNNIIPGRDVEALFKHLGPDYDWAVQSKILDDFCKLYSGLTLPTL